MTDKDALALLAEALNESGWWDHGAGTRDEWTESRFAQAIAATPSGARLLALVRDGLAVERLREWPVWDEPTVAASEHVEGVE